MGGVLAVFDIDGVVADVRLTSDFLTALYPFPYSCNQAQLLIALVTLTAGGTAVLLLHARRERLAARLRGEFIRKAQEKRRDFTVDWVHLKLNDQAQRTVLCKDPFKAVDDRVEKLIASM